MKQTPNEFPFLGHQRIWGLMSSAAHQMLSQRPLVVTANSPADRAIIFIFFTFPPEQWSEGHKWIITFPLTLTFIFYPLSLLIISSFYVVTQVYPLSFSYTLLVLVLILLYLLTFRFFFFLVLILLYFLIFPASLVL